MKNLSELILNRSEIKKGDKFAAIIGSNPSKGARSPKLWNAAFKFFNKDIIMHPLDVDTENIEDLISYLRDNKDFIGGAIAAPYKSEIAKLLKNHLTCEADAIGAINCLFRDTKGELTGTNTDGEAALKCLIDEYGSIKTKTVLILGFGGVGKAVTAYIAKELNNNSILYVASRSQIRNETKNTRVDKYIEIREINEYIDSIDIVINCTSVGWSNQENASPLNSGIFNRLKENSFIYDVIYQPLETKLLQIANMKKIKCMNGLSMNLEQAVLAFGYASPDLISSADEIELLRRVMKNV